MEAFKEYEIVPDVIDKEPSEILGVIYKEHNAVVHVGDQIAPRLATHQPIVEWHYDPSLYYTLIMIDPDSPNPKSPRDANWLHWLVVNIHANELNRGEVKAEYVGAGPHKDTGAHRYAFLLYKQHSKHDFSNFSFISKKNGTKRHNFDHK